MSYKCIGEATSLASVEERSSPKQDRHLTGSAGLQVWVHLAVVGSSALRNCEVEERAGGEDILEI